MGLALENGDAPDFGQWHLFPADVEAVLPDGERVAREIGETIDGDVLADALEHRQEYDPGCDISLTDVDTVGDRTLSFTGAEKAEDERKRRIFEERDIPRSLTSWADADPEMRENMLAVLDALDNDADGWLTSYDKLVTETGVSKSSLSTYLNDKAKLKRCLTKRDGSYELTNIGETALHTDWGKVSELV